MRLKEAEFENNRYSKLLEFSDRSEFSLVTSRVIAFDASNLRRSLVIDKGKKHGIKIGNPVITTDGVIGKVVGIGNSASRVLLINDLDFSMAAKVVRSNAIGVISGSLGGTCRLKYLDLDEDVVIGDEVVSSGEGSYFPPGIPIGKVKAVSKEQSGLTLFAIVKPHVKLSSLEEVLVIINY
jgi:rod shape-determining protein MreC